LFSVFVEKKLLLLLRYGDYWRHCCSIKLQIKWGLDSCGKSHTRATTFALTLALGGYRSYRSGVHCDKRIGKPYIRNVTVDMNHTRFSRSLLYSNETNEHQSGNWQNMLKYIYICTFSRGVLILKQANIMQYSSK